jgi:lysophospholipase L1-like esterase
LCKLIGFGASTMQGAGDSQGGFFKRLEGKLAEAGRARDCLNFGVGGNSTRDMLARFDAVKAHLPCPAVIVLGCNDLPRERDAWPQNRLSLADYAANLRTMFGAFDPAQTLFVSSFLPCQRRTGIDPAVFAAYLGTALKIAAEHKFAIWDLYAESLGFGDKFYADDGMHYNDAGHEYIAEQVFRRIG